MDAHTALELVKDATGRANEIAALQARDDFQDDSAPLTEEEQAEAKALHEKAKSQVGRALRIVRAQLAAMDSKDGSKKKQRRDESTQSTDATPVADKVSGPRGFFCRPDVAPDRTGVDDEVVVPVSSSDLDGVTETVDDMLNSASNVVNDFDEILVKPFLDEFSASLDLVPVIGIRGRKLMYTKHSLNDGGDAFTAFAEFDDLPEDAPEDISSAKVFPFNGDLYLSIGTAVWRKDHLGSGVDAIADSIDDWPRAYQEGWFKIGDDVFSADIVDAAFLALLPDAENPAGTPVIRFVLLDSSGQLYIFGGTLQTSGNTFVPVVFKASDGVEDAPVWEKIAYTRGNLHAFAKGEIWTLVLTLGEGSATYTVKDKTTVGDVVEMEGNEIGLVLRLADGFLYQQHVDVSDPEVPPAADDFLYEHPEAASGDPTLVDLAFKRWIDVPSDLRMIGVGEPGVKLNLRTLTSSLRSRYLRTQTVLYPVVEKIRTFATVHTFYLDYLQTEADKYSPTNPPSDEEAIAQADTYITHTAYWTEIINDAVSGVKGTVNLMAADSRNIKEQLKRQLLIIETELEGLNAALESLEDLNTDLKKQLGLGIGLLIAGVLTFLAVAFFGGPAIVVGGAVLLGTVLVYSGIVITRSASQGIVQNEEDIAQTEARIEILTTTHQQLAEISELYDGIDGAYESLNTFWGRMFNDARQLQAIVDVFDVLGAQLLLGSQSFNIPAAKQSVDSLFGGCTAYLDLLNSQGVQIGATRSAATASKCGPEWSKEGDAFDQSAYQPGPISECELDNDSDSFSRPAMFSQKLLQAGDVKGYLKHLEQELVPRGKVTAVVLKDKIVRVRV